MMRTYWLSFVDDETHDFLGVAVIDVEDEDAAAELAEAPDMHNPEDGPWVLAACRKAWEMACNPGGQVAAFHATADTPEQVAALERTPRNRLLQEAELRELGLIA